MFTSTRLILQLVRLFSTQLKTQKYKISAIQILGLLCFSYNLDGYDEAQHILKVHRDADPNNPTVIRLQFEMALKVASVGKMSSDPRVGAPRWSKLEQ